MTAGAGKTTQLINDTLELLKQGVNLREILILSFSKATVQEVKERLRARLTSLSDLDWSTASHNIRTQHSLCWSGLRGEYEVLDGSALNEFAKAYGWRISQKYVSPNADDFYAAAFSEGGFFATDDDKVFFQINLNRLSLLPPETGLAYEGEKNLARAMDHDYEHWKAEKGYTDYTGMVEHAIRKRHTPTGIRYILVDEAQDLCPLLYEYHKVLYTDHPDAEVRWYGDEDQCVYGFMGADPAIFVQQPSSETTFGEISYRLPAPIAAMANEYISRNKGRLPKVIKGQAKPGPLFKAMSWEQAAEHATAGTQGLVLWLCPTNSQCNKVKDQLRTAGYAMKLSEEEKQAIQALRFIQNRPLRLKAADLRLLTEAKVQGRKLFPYDRHWWAKPHEMNKQITAWISGSEDIGLTGISVDDDRLSPQLSEILRSGYIQPIFDSPGDDRQKTADNLLSSAQADYWIEVITFHKSKGREADTVVVLKDVMGKMLSSILWDPEAGRRAGFVAMTRTRGTLVLYRQEHERCRDWYKVTW